MPARDPKSLVTIERHFMEEERRAHHATGELTKLLNDIAFVAKTIGHEIRQAGLTDIVGSAGSKNVHGEAQQRLDIDLDGSGL